MSYTPENQKIEEVITVLNVNMKKFREAAENRIMDTNSWETTHRLKLKSIIDEMLNLQIKLNEL